MLNPAPEQLAVHRLDHEVNVIVLHAEVDHLEAITCRALDSPANGREDSLLAKTG